MDEHFDAVVVGSGFGGSVVTYRLAEAGRNVCLLERGRPYPPGSFPRSPREMARNLWDPGAGLYGMFDVWSFRGLEALVSSGLGGGSLIYANVLIRKDEAWFVDEQLPDGSYERWPVSRADLDPHYDRVEQMLEAQTYPFDRAPYRDTPKTRAMQEAATRLGLDWRLPKLAVSFANPGEPPVPGAAIDEDKPNLHHRPRSTCCLCGECDIGCNHGSKNTLDLTYLSRAEDCGAELRTLCEVRSIEPGGDGKGFRITYLRHPEHAEGTAAPRGSLPRTTVTADRLVLAAGSLGTTYLLLRNRSAFPHLGPALGTRFSGNGDVLTFLRHGRRRVDGAPVPRWLDAASGPVITSAIRIPDAVDGGGATGRGFYVEDGGNPQFLSWLVEAGGAPAVAGRLAAFAFRRAWAHLRNDPRSNFSSQVASLLGGGTASGCTLPMLTMGRDIPDGVMRLRRGDLDIDWSTRTSAGYFSGVEETLRRIADVLGADLVNTPLWLFKRVVTVHPVGGCPMGANPQEGVVDRDGQAFHYPGLFVADGAAMPGPVGPNPSLTIAACADRLADGILR